jgi:hypothetical protein
MRVDKQYCVGTRATAIVLTAVAGALTMGACGNSTKPSGAAANVRHATSSDGIVAIQGAASGGLTNPKREAEFARFGTDATSHDYTMIVGVLHRYYGALAKARFATACSLLSIAARDVLISAGRKNTGRTCGKQLADVFAQTLGVQRERVQFTIKRTRDVRVDGTGGYVLFTTVAAPAGEQVLSVGKEGGRWRVVAPIAISVVYETPSAAARVGSPSSG